MRSSAEIATMDRAGTVVAAMHARLRELAVPGATGSELDDAATEVLFSAGATSNFLGYHGFPATVCVSVNEVAVHGIPQDVALDAGDVVSFDCGAIIGGYHGDAAITVVVPGEAVSERTSARPAPSAALALVAAAEHALSAGIDQLMPGRRLGDVGAAIEASVAASGFMLVEGYGGHAIGTAMHESPTVPNEGTAGRGARIRVGNVFALEPILTTGSGDTYVADDGWTVVTSDAHVAVHVEHTIAVTPDGPRILTIA